MKIVIDIDEEDYAVILANADIVNKRKKHTLEEAVINGTPLPDNATNEDIFLLTHPNVVATEIRRFLEYRFGRRVQIEI